SPVQVGKKSSQTRAQGEAERIAAKQAKRVAAAADAMKRAGIVTQPPKGAPVHPPPKSRSRAEPPMSPALRVKRAARTKGMTGRIEETVRTIPEEWIGGAEPTEVLVRTKKTLKEVEIERYSDERLAQSVGLPRDWVGRIWENVVASLRWLRKHLAERAM